MKAFLRTADIHPDDEGTRLVVIHIDSRARKDSRDLFFFLPVPFLVSGVVSGVRIQRPRLSCEDQTFPFPFVLTYSSNRRPTPTIVNPTTS